MVARDANTGDSGYGDTEFIYTDGTVTFERDEVQMRDTSEEF